MEFMLEKFGPHDFDDYFRLVSDPKVMAMISERGIPADEARQDYADLLANNDIHPDMGQFRILQRKTSHFIGLAKLAVSAENRETAELGYMLLPEYWGQGIGGRIASMLVTRAEAQPDIRSLFAIIDPANLPSRKILINNGFVSREFKDLDGLPGEILERHCKPASGNRASQMRQTH